MDVYEKQQFEKLKEHRFIISDALSRSDDGLERKMWEKDQFGAAYIQLSRAANELHEMMRVVLAMRGRRLQMEGSFQQVPQG